MSFDILEAAIRRAGAAITAAQNAEIAGDRAARAVLGIKVAAEPTHYNSPVDPLATQGAALLAGVRQDIADDARRTARDAALLKAADDLAVLRLQIPGLVLDAIIDLGGISAAIRAKVGVDLTPEGD